MSTPLAQLLRRVLADRRISDAEHAQLTGQIDRDGLVDEEELSLMRELQRRLVDGSVVRVP